MESNPQSVFRRNHRVDILTIFYSINIRCEVHKTRLKIDGFLSGNPMPILYLGNIDKLRDY